MEIREMIEVLQAFEEGKEIEMQFVNNLNAWCIARTPTWDFPNINYRAKPQPTREEITEKWVKDNNIVVGSKVRVVKGFNDGFSGICKDESDSCIGGVFTIAGIFEEEILFEGYECWTFPIESLEPYKEQYQPFTYEDYMKFMGEKVEVDDCIGIVEWCDNYGIFTCGVRVSYEYAFNDITFINGSKFGKKL